MSSIKIFSLCQVDHFTKLIVIQELFLLFLRVGFVRLYLLAVIGKTMETDCDISCFYCVRLLNSILVLLPTKFALKAHKSSIF